MFVKLHHATCCKKSWVHNVWPVQPIIWSNHERWCNWMQPPNHFPWRMWLYPSVIGLLSKLFFVLKQCLKPIDTGANNSVCVYVVSYLPGYGAYYYITPNTGWRRQTKKKKKKLTEGSSASMKGRRKTVLPGEDRELADVIEIERDGISAGVAMNKHREGTEDNWVCEGERGQPCACVCECVCMEAFSYMPLSICVARMHAHVRESVCVCVRERIVVVMGGGESFSLKPWNWLTGAFPPWSAGCVCAAWNKDLAPREYPGDCHLHKNTITHNVVLSLSRPHVYLRECVCSKSMRSCTHLSPTHQPHRQSTS